MARPSARVRATFRPVVLIVTLVVLAQPLLPNVPAQLGDSPARAVAFTDVSHYPAAPASHEKLWVTTHAVCTSALRGSCEASLQWRAPSLGQSGTVAMHGSPHRSGTYELVATIGPFPPLTQVEYWVTSGAVQSAVQHVMWRNSLPTLDPSILGTRPALPTAPVVWDFAESDHGFQGGGATMRHDPEGGAIVVVREGATPEEWMSRDLVHPIAHGQSDHVFRVRYTAHEAYHSQTYHPLILEGEAHRLEVAFTQSHVGGDAVEVGLVPSSGAVTCTTPPGQPYRYAPIDGTAEARVFANGTWEARFLTVDGIVTASCAGRLPPEAILTRFRLGAAARSGGNYGDLRVWSIHAETTWHQYAVIGEDVTLVSNAADPDGYPTTTTWYLPEGVETTGLSATFQPSAHGLHFAQAVVTDAHGGQMARSLPVVVPNRAPAIGIVAEPAAPREGESVTLRCAPCDNHDGPRALDLRWDLGDGTTAVGDVVAHSFARHGLHRVRLVAGDGLDTVRAEADLRVYAAQAAVVGGVPGDRYDFLGTLHGFRVGHDSPRVVVAPDDEGWLRISSGAVAGRDEHHYAPLSRAYGPTDSWRAETTFRIDRAENETAFLPLVLSSTDLKRPMGPGALRVVVEREADAELPLVRVDVDPPTGNDGPTLLSYRIDPRERYTVSLTYDGATRVLTATLLDGAGDVVQADAAGLGDRIFVLSQMGVSSASHSRNVLLAAIDEIAMEPANQPSGARSHIARYEVIETTPEARYDWRFENGAVLQDAGPAVERALDVEGEKRVEVDVTLPDGTRATLHGPDMRIENRPPVVHARPPVPSGHIAATFLDGSDGFVMTQNAADDALRRGPGHLLIEAAPRETSTQGAARKLALAEPMTAAAPFQGAVQFTPLLGGTRVLTLLRMGESLDSVSLTLADNRISVGMFSRFSCTAQLDLARTYVATFSFDASTRAAECAVLDGRGTVLAAEQAIVPTAAVDGFHVTHLTMGTAGDVGTAAAARVEGIHLHHGHASYAPGNPILLTGAASRDPDPMDTLSTYWLRPDGSRVNGSHIAYTPPAGTTTLRFVASDGQHAREMDVPVTAGRALAPSLVVGAPQPILEGDLVTFELVGLPAEPVEVTWSFGDGSAATGPRVSHAFRDGGPQLVKAVATLGSLSVMRTAPVTVLSAEPRAVLVPDTADASRATLLHVAADFPGHEQTTVRLFPGAEPTQLPPVSASEGSLPWGDDRPLCARYRLATAPVEACTMPGLLRTLRAIETAPVDSVRVVRVRNGWTPSEPVSVIDRIVTIELGRDVGLPEAIKMALASRASILVVEDASLAHAPVDEQLLALARGMGLLVIAPAGDVAEPGAFQIQGLAASPHVLTVGAASRDGVASFSARGPSAHYMGTKPDLVAPYTRASTASAASAAAAVALAFSLKGVAQPDVVRSLLLGLSLPIDDGTRIPSVFEQGTGLLDPPCLGFGVRGAPLETGATIAERLKVRCVGLDVPELPELVARLAPEDQARTPIELVDLTVVGEQNLDLGVNLLVTTPHLPKVLNADFGIVNDRVPRTASMFWTSPGLSLDVTMDTRIDAVSDIMRDHGIDFDSVKLDIRNTPALEIKTELFHGARDLGPLTGTQNLLRMAAGQAVEDAAALYTLAVTDGFRAGLPPSRADAYHLVEDAYITPEPQDVIPGNLCPVLDPVFAAAESAAASADVLSGGVQDDVSRQTLAAVAAEVRRTAIGNGDGVACRDAHNITLQLRDEVAALRDAAIAAGLPSVGFDAILATLDAYGETIVSLKVKLLSLGGGGGRAVATIPARTVEAPLGFYGGFTRFTSKDVCLSLPATLEVVLCRDVSFFVPAALVLTNDVEVRMRFRDGSPIAGTTIDAYGAPEFDPWVSISNFERRWTDENGVARFHYVAPGDWYFRGYYDFGLEFDNFGDRTGGASSLHNVPFLRSQEGGSQLGSAALPGSPCGFLPEIRVPIAPADRTQSCLRFGKPPEIDVEGILDCLALELPRMRLDNPFVVEDIRAWAARPTLKDNPLISIPEDIWECIRDEVTPPGPAAPKSVHRLELVVGAAATSQQIDEVRFNEALTWSEQAKLPGVELDLASKSWRFDIRAMNRTHYTLASDDGKATQQAKDASYEARAIYANHSQLIVPQDGENAWDAWNRTVPELGVIDYRFPVPSHQYARVTVSFDASFHDADGWMVISDGSAPHDDATAIIKEWLHNKRYELHETCWECRGIRVVPLSATLDVSCSPPDESTGVCYRARARMLSGVGWRNYTFSSEFATFGVHPDQARITFVLAPVPDMELITQRDVQEQLHIVGRVNISNLRIRVLSFDSAPYGVAEVLDETWRESWRWSPRDLSRIEAYDAYVAIPKLQAHAFRLERSHGGTTTTEIPHPGEATVPPHCRGGGFFLDGCSAILGHMPGTGRHAHPATPVSPGGLFQHPAMEPESLNIVEPRITAGDDVGVVTSCGRARPTASTWTEQIHWDGYVLVPATSEAYSLRPGVPLTDRFYDDISSEFEVSLGSNYMAQRVTGFSCANTRGGPVGSNPGDVFGMMPEMSILDMEASALNDLLPELVRPGLWGSGSDPIRCMFALDTIFYEVTGMNAPVELPTVYCLFLNSNDLRSDAGPSAGRVANDSHMLWHIGLPVLSTPRPAVGAPGKYALENKGQVEVVFSERIAPALAGDICAHNPVVAEGRPAAYADGLDPTRDAYECWWPVVHKVKHFHAVGHDEPSRPPLNLT